MAQGLYIGATQPYSGKNMLTIGIGLRLQKEGLAPGFMKPVGSNVSEKKNKLGDEDALFIQDIFGLDYDADLVTPILITQDFKMRAFSGQSCTVIEDIKSAYDTLSAKHELMLLTGYGHMLSGTACNIDGIRLACELDLKVVIVDRLRQEVNYDLLISYKRVLGDRMIGAVLNDVPPSFQAEVESVIKPFLEKKGIPIIGVIPHDPFMGAIRAQDLAESLGGKVIAAQSRANGMVENFLIGTMQVENFITYFKRNPHTAVIVGGDRADVQLVAIEGNCPCLILTGNLYPNDIILSRADTLNIPIIMVREDTYTIAKKMELLLNSHKLHDVIKVRQCTQLVSEALDFNQLRTLLGI